jgi:hypothetical protein
MKKEHRISSLVEAKLQLDWVRRRVIIQKLT